MFLQWRESARACILAGTMSHELALNLEDGLI